MDNNLSKPELIVFKGEASQTGIAFKEEFPDVNIPNEKYNFDEIREKIKTKSIQVVLPMWNSHVGEITLSNALSMVFDEMAKLYFLWPEKIIFECLVRPLKKLKEKKLTSINVVKQQCSIFLQENDYVFHEEKSTVDAYEKFRDDGTFSAVLCAPGANVNKFTLLHDDVSNPINFTTFSILASPDSETWNEEQWGLLSEKILPSNNIYTGIQMAYSYPFSDSQEELFDTFIEDANNLNDVPKALFVAKHKENSCRILLEANAVFTSSIFLIDEGEDETIKIIPNIGGAGKEYAVRSVELLKTYTEFTSHDFVKHQGKNSCFFACPVLGIVTHGFESDVTENIVRMMIMKCFELLGQNIVATNEQKVFYDKYLDEYRDKGVEFIEFVNVGL